MPISESPNLGGISLTIAIKVQYLAVLRGLTDSPERLVQLRGTTLNDLVAELGHSEGAPLKQRLFMDGGIRPDVIIFINEVESSLVGGVEAKLKDGDEVIFLPSVHGG